MTECERIVREGILPPSFFEEETICDFLVTKERKKLWAILIDLLKQVNRICQKYHLKYTALGGTLLGAVRHGGFIPWDDDLDIGMPRADFDKFMEVAPKELRKPYYLQIPGNDYDYFYAFTKLRNSNTTAYSPCFRYCKHNQGIFLDIFPLDNCEISIINEDFKSMNNLILENSANMRRTNPFPSTRDIEKIQKYEARNPYTVLSELNEIIMKANDYSSEYCIITGCTVYPPHRLTYRWEDILDLIDVDFYGHKIKIPRNANKILAIAFGEDFMQFPPIEERGAWHQAIIFNPDCPYTDSLKNVIAQEERR